VLAIELYSAARAVDLRLRQYPHGQLGVGTQAALEAIRKEVPYQAGDALWGPEIEAIQQMIRQQRIPTSFDTNK
jgi:histidine ammonia-lyase